MKRTVVFDFDGVIHSYTSGWKGEDVIPDAPVPKIKEAIEQIRAAGYEVVVVSTRCATSRGMVAVAEYLENNEIAVDRICKEKPPAIVYIDDRAICFDGKSEELLSKIESFEPWYQRKEQASSLEEAIGFLKDVYAWAVKQKHIVKPLAYALYKTWQNANKGKGIRQ